MNTTSTDKPPLTTHVLNIQTGKPAVGVEVEVYAAQRSEPLAVGVTDADGRVAKWHQEIELPLGEYLIEFHVGKWFQQRGETTLYPKVSISFQVEDTVHYHIPLLLSPYGYSTYRGS